MAPAIARFLPDFSDAVVPVRGAPAPRAAASAPAAAPPPRPPEGLAALLRKPAEPPEDREALLRAAEARGLERGRALGRAEAGAESASVLACLQADHDARLVELRQAWCAEEGDRLAAGFADALQALGAGLTDRVGHLLVPVLTEALRRQAVDELAQSLARILGDARAPVRVSGPADLLDAVSGKLGPFDAAVAFQPSEAVDVSVQADQTVIETQLGAWGRLMTAAVRGA
ncbi:hypothetical protein ASF49_14775 [Methylobacterium sp. Leaf104]|uniref:hypothetical protein n=1 Tax=Methylobacterium TaxID=407 RepID=UPI0006FDE090|nr:MULTISPECIES: hypothetical protein [Methylobacterium]KQP29935.1 hypothetical protein ASF49_14775 [Methylobacterium sp. Leaf104]MCI9882366.1 hypothetical protein [Methylobacterium goesingense]